MVFIRFILNDKIFYDLKALLKIQSMNGHKGCDVNLTNIIQLTRFIVNI